MDTEIFSQRSLNWRDNLQKFGLKNLAMGIFSGVLATGLMTLFQDKLGPSVKKRVSRLDPVSPESPEPEIHRNAPKENPSTVKVANLIYRRLRGKELPEERHFRAGQIVHFSFGATQGINYALISTLTKKSGVRPGALFGMGVWLLADETFLPLIGVAKSARHYPLSTHVYGFAAHLVYGASLGTMLAALNHLTRWRTFSQMIRPRIPNRSRSAA